jgi:hypothetical protein
MYARYGLLWDKVVLSNSVPSKNLFSLLNFSVSKTILENHSFVQFLFNNFPAKIIFPFENKPKVTKIT